MLATEICLEQRIFKAVLELSAHEHPGFIAGDGPIINSFFNQHFHKLAPFGVSFNLGQNLFFLFRRNASVGNR